MIPREEFVRIIKLEMFPVGHHRIMILDHDEQQRARIAELEAENARMRGIINRRCEEIEAKILEKAIKDLEADQDVLRGERRPPMKMVYGYMDYSCGKKIVFDSISGVLEMIKESIENLDPACENRAQYSVTCEEMSDKEFTNMIEFDGC